MGFLLTHWHCILPIAVIGFFVFKSSGGKKDQETPSQSDQGNNFQSLESLDKKYASGEMTEDEYLRKKRLITGK